MTKYAQAAVVLAGQPPCGAALQRLRQLAADNSTLLLAADGGANSLHQLGLRPHIILGDDDSICPGIFPEVPRQQYAQQKDFTDGQAALQWAAKHCSGRIYLLGALGGRLDHMLTNLLLPLYLAADASRFVVLGDDFEAVFSNAYCCVNGQPGDLLSLLPLTPVRDISLSGLQYPLAGYDSRPGDSRMISNVLVEKQATICHREGWLMVVHYLPLED